MGREPEKQLNLMLPIEGKKTAAESPPDKAVSNTDWRWDVVKELADKGYIKTDE
jgi:hypothetical protein